MTAVKRFLATEPVAAFEALKTVLLSTLGMGPVFGWWHLSDTQMAVILAEYVAVTGAVAVFVRAQVIPKSKVALTHREADFVELGKATVINQPEGTH